MPYDGRRESVGVACSTRVSRVRAQQERGESATSVLDHVKRALEILRLATVGIRYLLAVMLVPILEQQLDLWLASRGADRPKTLQVWAVHHQDVIEAVEVVGRDAASHAGANL